MTFHLRGLEVLARESALLAHARDLPRAVEVSDLDDELKRLQGEKSLERQETSRLSDWARLARLGSGLSARIRRS